MARTAPAAFAAQWGERTWWPAGASAGACTVVLAVAGGCLMQGGYYSSGLLFLLLSLVAAAMLTDWPGSWVRIDRQVVALFGALVAWGAVEVALGADRAVTARLLGVAAATTLALLVGRRFSPLEATAVLHGLLGMGVVISVFGVVGVAGHVPGWAAPSAGLWRAMAGLSYANASATVLVMLGLVALSLLTARPRSSPLVVTCVVLWAGAASTLSRGGAVAAIVGLVAVLVVTRGLAFRAVLATSSGALIAMAFLVPSIPSANQPRVWLAAVGLVLGSATAVALMRLRARPSTLASWMAIGVLASTAVAWPRVSGLLGSRATWDSPRWETWSTA